MKDLHASRATYLISRLVAEGEHENQDFKFTVNDPRKIARSVSAFANHTGGRLLIGVNDNGVPRGVRSEEDIYVVEAAARLYCEPPCEPTFTAYRVDGGATVIRADIASASRRPVCVVEADGSRNAYFRVADENILAHPLMVRAWTAAETRKDGIVFELNADRSALLALLDNGPVTPEEAVTRLPMSRRTFENVVIDLAVLGIIDFRFINRHFHITRIDGEHSD